MSMPYSMTHHRCYLSAMLLLIMTFPAPSSAEEPKTGFMVVAPDRGFVGNQEIQTVFDEFKKAYFPASLVLVGRDYNGVGSEYSRYLGRALGELKQEGAGPIVAVLFFLLKADPVLQKIIRHLPSYEEAGAVRWAAPMADSYLIKQVLLDRVDAMSRDPEQERLLFIGFGATDEASEAAIRSDLDPLLTYITRRKHFKETRSILYYDRGAAEANEKNTAADRMITATAAKKGRTLVVLAAVGPKFDHTMALTTWFGDKFSELDVVYGGEELLPHPNILLWLKKTANAYVPAAEHELEVVIMPHGATLPYNDAIEQVIMPLKSRYRIEVAYGMGDPAVMQHAIARLEQQGVRRIIYVRMYALAHHLKDRTAYLLGLSDAMPEEHDDHDRALPPQIHSAALFATFGGYEEDPRIAQILHERITEVSREPARETVILVSHGDKSDEGNAKWLSIMQAHIERLKKDPHCAQIKSIRAATVREDWPEKREFAVADVRRMIQEGMREGRVLVIADRLYGSGPYKNLFNGLEYTLNEKRLSHSIMTGWLEDEIGGVASLLARPLDAPHHLAESGRGSRRSGLSR